MGKSLCRIFWLVSKKKKTKDDKLSHLFCKRRNWCLWALLPKWCRISAFCWKSLAKFEEEKHEGCSSWLQNDNWETRKWDCTCHLQSWIIQVCFLLHAIFYHKTIIKNYSIHVLKTILWAKTLKNYSNFFFIIWVKPRRWRWSSPTLWKIEDVMFIFLYHKMDLHFPETIEE